MTFRKKDITILLALFVITILCVRYFHKRMSDEQLVASVEPLSLIVPTPKTILSVNRPDVLSKFILPMENFRKVFTQRTPLFFQDIIQKKNDFPAFLLVYYPESVVMIASMNEQDANHLYKELDSYFDYSSLEKIKYGITMRYFPDIDKRFLASYYHQGVFVASYDNRLIKQIAKKQRFYPQTVLPEIQNAVQKKGRNAALNLYMPNEKLNLFVKTSDTTEWRLEDPWLGSDLFYNEGKVCCVHELNYDASLDSLQLYQNLSDTIQDRLNQLFPEIKTTTQVSHDEAVAYFTTCGQ